MQLHHFRFTKKGLAKIKWNMFSATYFDAKCSSHFCYIPWCQTRPFNTLQTGASLQVPDCLNIHTSLYQMCMVRVLKNMYIFSISRIESESKSSTNATKWRQIHWKGRSEEDWDDPKCLQCMWGRTISLAPNFDASMKSKHIPNDGCNLEGSIVTPTFLKL